MRRSTAPFACLVLTALAGPAWAGDVVFSVLNAKNRPVADAVITACPPGLEGGAAMRGKAAANEIVRTLAGASSGEASETVQVDLRGAPDRRGSY